MRTATNFKLAVLVTANISDLQKKLTQATAEIQRATKRVQKTGEQMTKYLTLPLTALGGVAVANAVKFEKLRVSLDVLTGSAEKGAEMFQRLTNYAARTPFQLGDLAKTNNMLLGFGLNAEQAFTALQQLGDVAALTGANINNIAIAYGQAAGEGRVMTRDLLQFVNNGVPIYKLLEEVTGANAAALRQMASEGKISFEILAEAMRRGTAEGGLFFEGTTKLSKTLGGQLSTLKDNFQLLMADFGQVMATVIKPLTGLLTALLQKFRGLDDSTKKWAVAIAAVAATLGPLLVAIGFFANTVLPIMATGFTALFSPVTAIVAAIIGMATALLYVNQNWDALKERFSDSGWWENRIIDMTQFILKYNPMQLLIDPLVRLFDLMGVEFPNMLNVTSQYLETLRKETGEYKHELMDLSSTIKGAIDEAIAAMTGRIKELTGALTESGDEMEETGSKAKRLQLDISKLLAMKFPDEAMEEGDPLSYMKNLEGQAANAANMIGQNLSGAFQEMLRLGKKPLEALTDMVKNMVAQLAVAAGVAALLSIVLNSMGFGAIGGISTSFGSLLGLFGGFGGVGVPTGGAGGVTPTNLSGKNGTSITMGGRMGGINNQPNIVVGRIQGDDIVLSLERSLNRRGRQTGSYGLNG